MTRHEVYVLMVGRGVDCGNVTGGSAFPFFGDMRNLGATGRFTGIPSNANGLRWIGGPGKLLRETKFGLKDSAQTIKL